MAAFYFKVIDNDGTIPADDAFDFPDLTAAIRQAKIVLAEMALDGLPEDPVKALEIEVLNADHRPVVRMKLELQILWSTG
ncbi:hypothetical protein LJR098_002989 [Rhizobium sp. LjRoot98]|uniref:DUF6894 family protein n=1 Tax=unclassified Rhizobium TaxID=2613769 RepID=UPI00071355AF|nr:MULTISPECIES: hypothetical protein [unclassified Rhizobium]KQV29462.1 hypothetical protein ASC96_12485 [Rhizobium sp. Root1204]KQY05385.1 hypothetical protein ASD36_13280 [Rhizobium sp. Root1334]KRC01996.1 hypothetical protein ASE23_11055 [Rhizobium sp. Root73]